MRSLATPGHVREVQQRLEISLATGAERLRDVDATMERAHNLLKQAYRCLERTLPPPSAGMETGPTRL